MKKILIIALLVLLLILGGIVYLYETQFSGAWIGLQSVKNLPVPVASIGEGSSQELPLTTLTPGQTPANFHLPKGFSMRVLADNLENPRTMVKMPDGTMLVALTSAGKIVEIIDKDGKAQVNTLIEGLDNPHGIVANCAKECSVLVAETSKLNAYTFETVPKHALKFDKKLADLPVGGLHVTRSLLMMPDQKHLLISIGSSCNVCHEENPLYGSVQILDLETLEMKPFATGLRNSVFMTTNPKTGEIWATEMGRDFLGDDLPPDEINILKENGVYGWPNCYGQNIHDTDFDKNIYIRNPCMEPFERAATIDIPAHSAPLGLTFIPKEGWPEDYAGDLLVAYHGSWNSSVPVGYKVVRYNFDSNGKLLDVEDFLTGFLEGETTLYGRPADILAMPGGVIYLSDDKAGRIYQINYGN